MECFKTTKKSLDNSGVKRLRDVGKGVCLFYFLFLAELLLYNCPFSPPSPWFLFSQNSLLNKWGSPKVLEQGYPTLKPLLMFMNPLSTLCTHCTEWLLCTRSSTKTISEDCQFMVLNQRKQLEMYLYISKQL